MPIPDNGGLVEKEEQKRDRSVHLETDLPTNWWQTYFSGQKWVKIPQMCGSWQVSLRSSQCPQEKSRERADKLWMSKIVTIGTREAEQEHMRGTTGGQKMYIRDSWDEQQMDYWGPTPNWEYVIRNVLLTNDIKQIFHARLAPNWNSPWSFRKWDKTTLLKWQLNFLFS